MMILHRSRHLVETSVTEANHRVGIVGHAQIPEREIPAPGRGARGCCTLRSHGLPRWPVNLNFNPGPANCRRAKP